MKDSGVPWIGDMPAGWTVLPSKRLFANMTETRRDGDIQLAATQKYGILGQQEYMELTGGRIVVAEKGLESWKHVEPNDYIISLRSFQGGLEWSGVAGCITWHYIVLRAIEQVHHGFYRWLFKSSTYITALQRTCNYIRDGQDLRFSNFAQVPLPYPPLHAQRSIADFLDRATAAIDAAITKTLESIEEYEKLKHAVITQAVTKGIRPGTIFKKTTLGKISVEIQTGPFGSQLHQSDYTKEGIPVVMPKNLVGGIICDVDIARVNMAFVERLAQHKITKGNLLYSRRGEVGRCALASEVNEGWLCGTGCLRVRLNEQAAYPKYVMYQAAQASTMIWIQLHAVGTTMLNINSSILQSVPIEIPSFLEQQEIVAYLDEKCGAIDALIEKKRQIITELESYKKSLIYEYVTGKKEVPA